MDLSNEQMSQLKQVELDIFKAFLTICEQLNLRYYLLGGTLLGAVRHKGFIPWDDDIDVGMPRKDYEIFLEKGQSLLPKNLFIQNIKTEKNCPYNFTKIRKSDTAFIESSIHHFSINHGIFLDIFPLDYYPETPKKQKKIDFWNKIYTSRVGFEFDLPGNRFPSLKRRILRLWLKIIFPSWQKALLKREKLMKSTLTETLTANYCGAWGKKEIVPTEWYGQGTMLEFEGLQVCAPSNYQAWLTQVYGDYMQLPPIEKQKTHHYTDVIDFERSYLEYMEDKNK